MFCLGFIRQYQRYHHCTALYVKIFVWLRLCQTWRHLLPSWQLALKAERKSPGTIRTYTDGVTKFLRWCETNKRAPELSRVVVQAFLADLLDEGMEGNTARSRDLALKRYAAWLVDEGELSANPLVGLKPPKADSKVVNALSDDQLRRLIKACQGKSLQDRRDEAIVRLMAETGMRAGEVLALQVSDVKLQDGLVTVVRGKGGKGRICPFGSQTAAAIDRYLRARRSHRLADTGALWVGASGKSYGYFALNAGLKARAKPPASKGSIRTCCGTPPLPAGCAPADPKVA